MDMRLTKNCKGFVEIVLKSNSVDQEVIRILKSLSINNIILSINQFSKDTRFIINFSIPSSKYQNFIWWNDYCSWGSDFKVQVYLQGLKEISSWY